MSVWAFVKDDDSVRCRCCLQWSTTDNSPSIPLFEGAEALQLQYMIRSCTGLTVSLEHGLPESICANCSLRLENAFEFRKQCIESDTNLKNPPTDVKTEVFSYADNCVESPDAYDEFDDRNSCDDYLPLTAFQTFDECKILITDSKKQYKLDKKHDRTEKSVKRKKTKKLKKIKKCKLESSSNGVNVTSPNLEIVETNSTIKHEFDLTDPTEKSIEELYYGPDFSSVPAKKKRKPKAKGQFFCDTCGHCVKVKYDLIPHFRRHTGEKPFKCETCGKCFAHDGTYRIHKKLHTGGVKSFMCDVCGKVLSTNDTLMAHRRLHTGEMPYTCTTCNRSFRALTNLRSHRKIHTGDKRYPCPECNKLFYTKSDMREHARRHTGERPFSCPLCPKRFTGRSNMKLHVKIHAGQKDFECTDCPKTFVSKDSLRRHSRTHSGVRAFECIECGKRFAHKSSLVAHKAIHSKSKNFVCEICDQRFGYPSGLYVHRKKKHNIQKSRQLIPLISEPDSELKKIT